MDWRVVHEVRNDQGSVATGPLQGHEKAGLYTLQRTWIWIRMPISGLEIPSPQRKTCELVLFVFFACSLCSSSISARHISALYPYLAPCRRFAVRFMHNDVFVACSSGGAAICTGQRGQPASLVPFARSGAEAQRRRCTAPQHCAHAIACGGRRLGTLSG